MADNEVRPLIIKRKKVSGGDGHHGGAWKVAMVSLSYLFLGAVFRASLQTTPW